VTFANQLNTSGGSGKLTIQTFDGTSSVPLYVTSSSTITGGIEVVRPGDPARFGGSTLVLAGPNAALRTGSGTMTNMSIKGGSTLLVDDTSAAPNCEHLPGAVGVTLESSQLQLQAN
jgi:hypothetical protein